MEKLILVGTGLMASDYSKVLKELNEDFLVIGRGKASSKRFESETGIEPITGGLSVFLENYDISKVKKAIIAVGTEQLMLTMKELVRKGIKNILIEKPGAISIAELVGNESFITNYGKNIYVAYNRRFYASTIEVKKMIDKDGGLDSFHFEFTEWSHKIEPLEKYPGVKEGWFFANSSHIVDLSFYLGGNPVQMSSYTASGNLKWHSNSNFAGAGMTKSGALFSYKANWEAPGRWGIELMTKKRRIILQPIEEIKVQEIGSVEINEFKFNNELDLTFKPGIYLQTKLFLESSDELLSLQQHLENTKKIYKIIDCQNKDGYCDLKKPNFK